MKPTRRWSSAGESAHHRLREEERKFFQGSGKILTEAQKSELAGQYETDYERMKAVLAAS